MDRYIAMEKYNIWIFFLINYAIIFLISSISARPDVLQETDPSSDAISGRMVSISAKAYRNEFKAPISLGECPLVMLEGSIKTCTEKFDGDKVFIPKASTVVAVSKVQSSEDILLHTMGAVETTVGVLGLVSVSPKISVAVTTQTNRKTLNLLSSYTLSKGVVALQNPRPVSTIGSNGALFLSEIELGGHELFLVTLDFESENKKTQVEISVTFKIVFISITAKLKFAVERFKSKAKVRLQLKSSWRENLDETYPTLEMAIPRVEEVEKMYMEGPKNLTEMEDDDYLLHNVYYFSGWKRSPFGENFNLALINHDIEFLTEQNTEILAVIKRIERALKTIQGKLKKPEILKLNETLAEKTDNLTKGLASYHELSTEEKTQLRDIYGADKAPLYYQRALNKILS